MRSVAILALAALLCTAASATVTVATTQAQAKALKDTWPACSSIVKGRLGSLSSFNATTDAPYVIDATVYNGNVSSGTVHYTPCTTSVADFNNNKANLQVSIAYLTRFAGHPPSPVNAAYNVDSTVFSMPTQKGDVPKFIASMTIVTDASTGPHNAVVTTLCAPTDNNGALSTGNYSISADGLTLNIQLTDMNACPRFPYTNEAMPSGAIAALIVVIACFVIQFGICGWYHMTHKQDTPFTEHQVE